jgi:hypothetical protein
MKALLGLSVLFAAQLTFAAAPKVKCLVSYGDGTAEGIAHRSETLQGSELAKGSIGAFAYTISSIEHCGGDGDAISCNGEFGLSAHITHATGSSSGTYVELRPRAALYLNLEQGATVLHIACQQ